MMKVFYKLCKRVRVGFSLFEAIVAVIILGVVGIVCSSTLLHISHNLAYTRVVNDRAARIALLQLENLLQYAIAQSLQSAPNTPLQTSTSSLEFYTLDETSLFGLDSVLLLHDTRLPSYAFEVSAWHDKELIFTQLYGYRIGDILYLYTQPEESFVPYRVTAVGISSLTLDRFPTQPPRAAFKIRPHKVEFRDSALWVDGMQIALDVNTFTIQPYYTNNGVFLELNLCVMHTKKTQCEQGGAWLTSFVEKL